MTSTAQDHQTGDPGFRVVVNDEEQYSIWPSHKENPPGWHDTGFVAGREECLAHIEEVWTDMRPRSVRERLDVATPAPVVSLLASLLEVDETELTDDAGPRTLAAWTSRKHIELVVAVEKSFGVSLSHEEIVGVTSVAALRKTLRAKDVLA